MFKKILSNYGYLLITLWVVMCSPAAAGNTDQVTIYLFSVKGCIHCLEEKKFLTKLEKKYPNIKVVEIELTGKKENQEIFKKVASQLNVKVAGVPFTVIGNIPIVGWHDEVLTGATIERAIQEVQDRRLPDVTAPFLSPDEELPVRAEGPQRPESLTLPIIGVIETKHLSLVLLTVIIGALDGFNPCAMWALIFLIGLLLGMENRKRMWALGGLFIGGSGLVYFLFMAAWLNVFLFLGFVVWIRVVIGSIALAAAALNFREYFRDKSGSCPLGGEKRQSWRAKIQTAIEHKSFWLAAAGIFLLGVAVNLVELFCSAGLPVVYTQILTLSRLPVWQYYAYLSLYILVFMLDDLIVFAVAMLTLQHIGIGARYKRFANLIGGGVLLLVGLLLIFKPGALMFG
jgi:glutaredoxin